MPPEIPALKQGSRERCVRGHVVMADPSLGINGRASLELPVQCSVDSFSESSELISTRIDLSHVAGVEATRPLS